MPPPSDRKVRTRWSPALSVPDHALVAEPSIKPTSREDGLPSPGLRTDRPTDVCNGPPLVGGSFVSRYMPFACLGGHTTATPRPTMSGMGIGPENRLTWETVRSGMPMVI